MKILDIAVDTWKSLDIADDTWKIFHCLCVFMFGTFFTAFVYFIWKFVVTMKMLVYSVHLNLSSNSPIFAKCASGNSPRLPPLKRTPGSQYRLLSFHFERGSQASSSTSHVSNTSHQPERHFFTKEHMVLVFETTQANRKYFVGQILNHVHPSDKNYDE